MGAGLYTYRRRYISLAGALGLALGARVLPAQERVTERHGFDEPEGRLLAFYSSTMAFTPAGIAGDRSRLGFGVEVSHVPWLNAAQRRPSIDKPEATNLAPLFPRPRLHLGAGGWGIEASWIPPLDLFAVEANVASVGVSTPPVAVGSFAVTPRIWGVYGRVEGAMTCAESEMLGKGAELELYFAKVCHGRESRDWFEPRMLATEVVVSRAIGTGIGVYALAGGRMDRTRFDIGVITDGGARDPDHPILELHASRPHFAGGVTWRAAGAIALGGEVFYAPGSVVTARVSGRWVVRR